VAVQHFGKSTNGRGEFRQAGLVVLHHFHLHEHLHAKAEFLAIQQRDDPGDVPIVLEPLNASPARRLRQADRLGDFGR
jgi:hypothetical protein